MSFNWDVLGAPLLAGLLVVVTHVPLGRQVLARGIIFIDLTIAQVAVLGALIAEASGIAGEGWRVQVPAAAAALAAAALLAWTERRLPRIQEALIGSLFVLAASAAVLTVADNPHGAEHLEQLMSGQILWVGMAEVTQLSLCYAPLLAVWWLWARQRPRAFYFVFALAVIASVQVVGVYLVFATLILPALAAYGLDERRGLGLAGALAAAGYALGLAMSVPLDLPAGPLIVCALGALALLAGLVRRAAVTPSSP